MTRTKTGETLRGIEREGEGKEELEVRRLLSHSGERNIGAIQFGRNNIEGNAKKPDKEVK